MKIALAIIAALVALALLTGWDVQRVDSATFLRVNRLTGSTCIDPAERDPALRAQLAENYRQMFATVRICEPFGVAFLRRVRGWTADR